MTQTHKVVVGQKFSVKFAREIARAHAHKTNEEVFPMIWPILFVANPRPSKTLGFQRDEIYVSEPKLLDKQFFFFLLP